MVSLGKNLKMPKTWEKFENRPYCKGYSPCKRYSLCTMVSFGQNLKIPKTCVKLIHNNIRVGLCKKPPEKTPNIGELEKFENWPYCKGYIAHAKAIVFAKWSAWVKIKKCQKHEKNPSTVTLQLFCAKNRSKKHQILEK